MSRKPDDLLNLNLKEGKFIRRVYKAAYYLYPEFPFTHLHPQPLYTSVQNNPSILVSARVRSHDPRQRLKTEANLNQYTGMHFVAGF